MNDTRSILSALSEGGISVEEAEQRLRAAAFSDLGHSRVDHDRAGRTGSAEVVFGTGKTTGQLLDIAGSLADRGQNVLVTRIGSDKAEPLLERFPEGRYCGTARLFQLKVSEPEPVETRIVVACAGTSDLPVAEEARQTAEFFGNPVDAVYDAGVAGLHRLAADASTLQQARVVVVVAGMEGALPSVVGGLVRAPVIAVPTSVGYGASFGGIAALLGMLNSCASGVSVMNIDNGFGAGFLANRINRL